MDSVYVIDNLTGLYTPYAERLKTRGKAITGEVFIDWVDMHSAYRRYGDEKVARELRRISDFLKHTFYTVPGTHLTYISGDNIRICSTTLQSDELLNILHASGSNFTGIAKLVCGKGFPDPLTKEVFEYWKKHPESRFQLRLPKRAQNVCTLDLRHLRKYTEIVGMEFAENEISKFVTMMSTFFAMAEVYRTRCDEVWVFTSMLLSRLEAMMEMFSNNYKDPLEFDWGVGDTLHASHEDLKRRKSESGVIRSQKGDFVFAG